MMTYKNLHLSSLLNPEQILLDLHDKQLNHVIHKLAVCINDIEPFIDSKRINQLIFERGYCGVMMVQPRIAVFHVRCEGLKTFRMALAPSREGFICSSEEYKFKSNGMDFSQINIVILMMAPFDDPITYIRAVSSLKVLCKHKDFIEQLLSQQNSKDIWKIFDTMLGQLPDFVEAQHIMRTTFSQLNVSDTLNQAIDLFCQEGIGEYPVVDDDGDLVGIVSEEQLMKLCLPEYITWMEDLSPILNFEPFAEILRYEKVMPVMDIMAYAESYATVDESTPAVQVAKVMIRRDVQQVFVVRNQKLMGIISINDFIHKVLRA